MNKPDPTPKPEYKVAEVREDGVAVLELGDGRMFPATVPADVEGVKKKATVTLADGDLDKEGVPVEAVITKVL